MPELVELSSTEHTSKKVVASAVIEHASTQHVLHINASEIAQAATCFPVFMSRNNDNGQFVFSAMTSFTIKRNLFVRNSVWEAVFQPASVQTYPLYLMKSAEDDTKFTVGFDPDSPALSDTEGKPLFAEVGKASEHLSMVTQLLETNLQGFQQNYNLAQTLERLNLLKEIDLQVVYQDGQHNTIKGLHTINEDVFRTLPAEELAKLNESGYLMPIHAMLMSLFQLNVLINKNNASDDLLKVTTVKMEVSKALA